jgi:Lrp/AsnC family leucine-responsive transcriptional regulator
MLKIDLKDRKILYELDSDCRKSNTQVGKKVGLKKDVVSYRIKKLQEEGVIQFFYTVIDAFKLGYSSYRYYVNFQYVNENIKNEIVKYFVNYKNICTVGEALGKYDLIVVVWVKDINEFYQFWSKALDKFGDYFETKIFSVYVHGVGFRQSYLLLDNYKIEDRVDHEYFGVGKTVEIDETDYHLLNEMALNARAPLIELAEKFKCSSQTINYRIKRLKKEGLIQGFRVAVKESSIGFKRYKVDIYLKNHNQRINIINYIKKNPHLLYISTSTGLCDLEFEFKVKEQKDLISIIEDINYKFPNSIKNYSVYGDLKTYKETFLPKLF